MSERLPDHVYQADAIARMNVVTFSRALRGIVLSGDILFSDFYNVLGRLLDSIDRAEMEDDELDEVWERVFGGEEGETLPDRLSFLMRRASFSEQQIFEVMRLFFGDSLDFTPDSLAKPILYMSAERIVGSQGIEKMRRPYGMYVLRIRDKIRTEVTTPRAERSGKARLRSEMEDGFTPDIPSRRRRGFLK